MGGNESVLSYVIRNTEAEIFDDAAKAVRLHLV
jgi:hypothetical protein